MRPFCETSSSAKTLTDEKKIGKALRSSRFPMIDLYEVRIYNSRGDYQIIRSFKSKQAARVFKSFHEFERGERVAIVACKYRYADSDSLKLVDQQ